VLSTAAHAMSWQGHFTPQLVSPYQPSLLVSSYQLTLLVWLLSTVTSLIPQCLAESSHISFSVSPFAKDYLENEKVGEVFKNLTKPSVTCEYGSCSQVCIKSLRECRCHENYELQKNSRHGICSPKKFKKAGVLLSVTDKNLLIQDPDKSIASVLMKGHFEKYHDSQRLDLLNRMAFDIRARKLYYWIAHDGPQRVIEIDIKIDQTMKDVKPRELFFPDLNAVTGFAVDWMTHNFYFTDATKRTITVCKRDGICVDLIHFERYTPYDIIVDVISSKMYWVGVHDSGTGSIEGSQLDGSELTTLCITFKYEIRSLALDPFQTVIRNPDIEPYNLRLNTTKKFGPRIPGQLYFVCKQNSGRIIMTIDANGYRAKRLKTFNSNSDIRSLSIYGPDLLAVANTDFKRSRTAIQHGNLLRMNRFIPNPRARVMTSLSANLFALHYFHPASTPQLGESPCKGSPCEHICIAHFRFLPARRTCICREGYVLGKDHKSCNREDPLLLAFANSIMIYYPHATFGSANLPYIARPQISHKTKSVSSFWWSNVTVAGLVDITSLALHRKWNLLYYADDAKDIIGVTHVEDSHWTKHELKRNASMKTKPTLDFSKPLKKGNMYTVKTLAVDWISDVLYWLEGDILSPGVWVSQLDGSDPVQIVGKHNMFKPTSIAIHPVAGLLFLADSVGMGFIDKCRMDGTVCHPLIVSTESPANLVVDAENDLVYWTSLKGGAIKQSCINVITIRGTQKRTILEGIAHPPTSLSLQNGRLFWTDTKGDFINVVDVNGKNKASYHDIKGRKMRAVLGMDVYQSAMQNGCSEKNGGCSHHCVPLPNLKRACLCPNGMIYNGTDCVEKSCSPNRFRCDSGICIPQQLVCDSYRDCMTGEDEKNCTQKCQGFTCKNGECLLNNKDRCDGFKDCRDGSDEIGCGKVKCPSGLKRCKNNQCIISDFFCDRQDDCDDKSDEAECEYPEVRCAKDQYYCPSLHLCQKLDWMCDGENDCANPESPTTFFDESNCTNVKKVCKNNDEWRCAYSKECVKISRVCDGKKDCPSGEDERENVCKSPEWQGCAHNEFTCEKGKCIAKSKECDHIIDCENGLDERDCNYKRCGKMELYCDGKCLEEQYRCDGQKQCSDGSDESNCTRLHFHGDCLKTQFECDNGRQCIELTQVCDKFADCDDHSDEGGRCDNACENNGGCDKFCRKTPIGPFCSCPHGFRLDQSRRRCVDIDECAEDLYRCSQVCSNRKGSFDCSCIDGYISSAVAHHSGKQGFTADANSAHHHYHHSYFCKAALGKPRLLIAQADKIYKISNIGADLAVDHHETYYAAAFTSYDLDEDSRFTPYFDYDIKHEELIWGYRSKDSMSKIKINENTFLVSFKISCMAYDWITGNIYVGDSATKSIGLVSRKPVINTFPNLVSGVDIPRCIALNLLSGFMYWGQFDGKGNNGGIYKATLDGKNSKQLTSHLTAKRPSSMTIDYARNRLVWIDKWLGIVSWLPLDNDAAAPVELVRIMHHGPAQIDLFEDSLYILNDWFHRVSQINMLHHDEVVTLHQFSWLKAPPHGIKVIHPYRQPARSNPCESKPCSQFCVVAPSNAPRSSSSQGFICLGDDVSGKSGGETKDNPSSATRATANLMTTQPTTTKSTTTKPTTMKPTTTQPMITQSTTTKPTTTKPTTTKPTTTKPTTTKPTTTKPTTFKSTTTKPTTTEPTTPKAAITKLNTLTTTNTISTTTAEVTAITKPRSTINPKSTTAGRTTTKPGCSVKQCQNGGSCVKSFLYGFHCVCRFGFYGDQCQYTHAIRRGNLLRKKPTTSTKSTTTSIAKSATATTSTATTLSIKIATTTLQSEAVMPTVEDLHRIKSRKGIEFPTNSHANWSTHDQELDAHDMEMYEGGSAKSTAKLEPAAVAAIILALVILLVGILMFVYLRKYKRDFLENQVVVRFRRPDARAFDNEDSIQVNDCSRSVDTTIIEEDEDDDDGNNNSVIKNNNNVAVSRDKDGEDRKKEESEDKTPAATFREAPAGESRLRKIVGDCREKLKINRKKDDSMTAPLDNTVPLDDTLIEDQTWHSSIRDVPIRQATHSPAVLAISSGTEFDSPTIQPANPPRTILKIFGESAEATNDAVLPGSSDLRRFKSQLLDKSVLFPYLTPTPSESEEDSASLEEDEVSLEGPEEGNRLLTL